MKKAIVTGIRGMMGRHMSQFLLEKNYEVVATYRHSTAGIIEKLQEAHLENRVILECCDIADSGSVNKLVERYKPDEFYSYAAQSDVKISFDQPELTLRTNIFGTLNILNALRDFSPSTKLLNCSSSEMFGNMVNPDGFRDESTPMRSRSPYATSKIAAHNLVINYREGQKLFAANSICFNHTSELRGVNFVERKISDYIGRLVNGLTKEKLKLGNIEAKRDFTYALDICVGQQAMLQQEVPDDFVFASGYTKSIRELLQFMFDLIGRNYENYIEYDKTFARPSELHELIGNSAKARKILNWAPSKSFEEMMGILVEKDINKYAL